MDGRAEDVWRARYAHPCAWDQDFPPLAMTALFAEAAAAHGDAPLVDFFGRLYSYRALFAEAQAFAAGLQAMGLGRGDRVGLYLPNVPCYVPAYFGAMLAGAVVVNFSPLHSAHELEAQVADSGARLMVTLDVPALLPTALEVLARSALERLVVARLEQMLPFAQGVGIRLFRRREILAVPRQPDVTEWRHAVVHRQPEAVAIDPLRDLALLQYTGGTTGTPKGAMLTHQNLSANARQLVIIDPHRGERDVILGALPLFHVFANAAVLNRTVFAGGCIAMLPRFQAGQVLKALARARATAMPGVPTMYQALLDHPAVARTDFSSLRVCSSGGAPLALPLKNRFEAATGARLIEGYGLTETAGVAAVNPYDGDDRTGTIGHPLPGTRLMLLDKEDSSRKASPGAAGELAVRGPQVMVGYWNHPEADAAAFAEIDGERWLRTGDIAEIDADGYPRIVDRSKDMIAVGGFKVFPSEVEAVLLRHRAIKEALVIGVADAYLGEVPRAFVTLMPDEVVGGAALREWANARLGKHERVDEVIVRTGLPRTMVGKLDRAALREEVALPAP